MTGIQTTGSANTADAAPSSSNTITKVTFTPDFHRRGTPSSYLTYGDSGFIGSVARYLGYVPLVPRTSEAQLVAAEIDTDKIPV